MADPLVIGTLFEAGKWAIDRLFPNPEDKAKNILELERLKQTGDLAELDAYVKGLQGQLGINAKEAEHKSIFVAGWRPFVGWVCGIGLAYISILEPIMRFAAAMNGYTGEFPVIDTTLTMQVLLGMLGIGALRSMDKKNKVETNSL